jgi:hypothetical protein
MRLSICFSIEASLIRSPSLEIGGEWSTEATLEYEVFVPLGITLREVSIEAFIFRLSRPRFPLQDVLGPVLGPLGPDKLVSYANV